MSIVTVNNYMVPEKCIFVFLEKKAIERVEKIIEISSKLGTIHQFCEFVEDVQIAKCQKSDCPIEVMFMLLN